MQLRYLLHVLIFLLFSIATTIGKQLTCEVCISFLKKVVDATPESDRSNPKKLDERIKDMCKKSSGKEHRFCWYIGALPDSATGIMNEVTKPLATYFPVERVCRNLGDKDAQICELENDKPIDWKTIDLNKLKVKELKKILDRWNEQCKGCTEKSEYVRRIVELKPKFVQEEL